MPSWVLLLVLAAVFLLLLCGAVVCGWLAGSYASEGPLGPGGYLVGALGVATPWGLVVLRHNRASR